MSKNKILCPYCFKHFYNTEVACQCENNEKSAAGNDYCSKTVNSKFNEYWKVEGVESRRVFTPQRGLFSMFGSATKPGKCPECKMESKKFVCPHCNNWLPTEMIERGSEIISIIGGPASGKTNYMITLIHQLQKYGYKLGLQITPQQVGRNRNEYTLNIYKQNKQRLFDENQVIDKTLTNKKSIPWILKLESHRTKKAIYLVFYDTAGEHFEDPETMKNNAKYVAESTAAIVLFDILALDSVRSTLARKGILPDGNPTSVLEMLYTIKNNEDKSFFKKPVAFVFSKFDLIINNKEEWADHHLGFTDENSSYIKTEKLDLDEMNDMHKSIKDIMKDADFGDLGQAVEDVENDWKNKHCFFGVSAFGGQPDKDNTIRNVKPYRVMDPLVWILHKIGGFDIPTT